MTVDGPSGLLLVRGDREAVVAWARHGLSAVHVRRLGQWCAVAPAEVSTHLDPPYDDPMVALVSRPLGGRLRPALGFFTTGERAVVTLRPGGIRPGLRGLVRVTGTGIVRTPRIARLRPADLVAHGTGDGADALALLRDEATEPTAWLARLVDALGLPGAGILTGEDRHDPGVIVEPHPGRRERFVAAVAGSTGARAGVGARA